MAGVAMVDVSLVFAYVCTSRMSREFSDSGTPSVVSFHVLAKRFLSNVSTFANSLKYWECAVSLAMMAIGMPCRKREM